MSPQPLQPGRAPAGRLDQLDHLVGVGPAGQRQLLGDRRVVVVVVVVGLPAELAQPLPGLAAQGLDRVAPAPQAPRTAPAGPPGRPPRQAASAAPGSGRVHSRCRSMTASNGPGGGSSAPPWTTSTSRPSRSAVLPQTLQHPAGQVEGGHPVAEPGRGQRQEPRPGADVQHPAPRAGQQPVQGGVPGGPHGRRGHRPAVVGGVVVGGGVRVPPGTDPAGQVVPVGSLTAPGGGFSRAGRPGRRRARGPGGGPRGH